MVQESTLTRIGERISSYINKYVNLVGIEQKEEVLEMFDNLYRLFPHWVIATCHKLHPGLLYTSKNITSVFGYSKEYMFGISPLEKYFQHVHEADQEDLKECVSYIHEQLQNIPPGDHHLYRSIFHYRFRKENGQYIYLHDEKATLKLPGSGNLYYTLYRDVTAEKKFTGVKAEIFRQKQVLTKVEEYRPSVTRLTLSKREEQLLGLIKQGFSTKEIAWSLEISHHTVRNIKSKLFEKYNVSNSIELLNMAG
jgi:DNA-binding CsgD family transcriptional regulator